MKIGFLITARLKSTRLPKKVILKIDGREFIALMIKRLKLSKAVDDIVVATSTNPQDNPLAKIALRENVKCFRGSEDDVLERLYLASKEFGLDYILNLTADCPLLAYEFIEKVVEMHKKTDADLITISKLPHGFFFWGIKPAALKKILEIKEAQDTEVWLRYFTETKMFKVVDLDVPQHYRRNYRLSLDYPEDYDFFKALFNGMKNAHLKPTKEIIEFLDKHPEIVDINLHCEEMYKKRWESQNKLKLKQK